MKKIWEQLWFPEDYKKLGQELGVSPVVARCIRNRNKPGVDNLVTADQMFHYLNDTMDDLHDPKLLKGACTAVELLKERLAGDGKVAIASDYDCDGVCSGVILKKGLNKVGFSADIYTPDRQKDGYGLNRRVVDEALADGHTFLLTCDNGIAAVDGVAYAKEKGMTVVVTDHHEPQEELPPADVIVDPKQAGETYPFDGLCGAGVAYKVLSLLYAELGAPEGEELLHHELLELTAIATIADMMDLIDENRIFVKFGLPALARTENVGLRSLMDKLGYEERWMDSRGIGFHLGPVINSAGRFSQVEAAIGLLEETNEARADVRADELLELNKMRRQMSDEAGKKGFDVLYKTFPDIENGKVDDVIVLYVPEIHESTVGLVATKIKERFKHPAIVLTDASDGDSDGSENDPDQAGLLRGSGRSIEAYDMFEHLTKHTDLTEKVGGHTMAVGLTIRKENVEELRSRLNADCPLCAEDYAQKVMIDVEVPISYVSRNLIREIEYMQPFGNGNTQPLFAQRDLEVSRIVYMGADNQHLKIKVKDPKGTKLDAIAFGRARAFDEAIIHTYGEDELALMREGKSDKRITLAYQPYLNEYRGFRTIQLRIVEWVV